MHQAVAARYAATAKVIFTKTVARNSSTAVAADIRDKRLALKHKADADAKPEGWDRALPFDKIPGPKPLPLIGNIWRYLPYIGEFYGKNMVEMQKMLHEKYGDIAVLKGVLIVDDLVVIFSPDDFEFFHRNEGAFPARNLMKSLLYYRTKVRANEFQGVNGLITEGEEWYNFRSKVNPVLMKPNIILQYVESMDHITNDFLQQVRQLSLKNPNGDMPEDFLHHIYNWSFESVACVALDKRLGCLDPNMQKNSEPQMLIKTLLRMFSLLYKIEFLPSLRNKYSTKTWKEYVRLLDKITFTFLRYINEAKQKLENGGSIKHGKSEQSILQQLLEIDPKVALPMAIDLLTAGVDTTGKVAGAGLYYLAKNPHVQNKLRQEMCTLLPSKNTPLTKEVLANAPYLKATLKEILRLAPIGVGILRETTKDMVLQGYQIPKGKSILTSCLLHCHSDKYYAKASEFIPDRWMRSNNSELSHKNTPPFVYLPFGFGPRSCIGMRLANLELEVLMGKIVRNFKIEWHHEDMVFKSVPFYGVAKPLKIRVKELHF